MNKKTLMMGAAILVLVAFGLGIFIFQNKQGEERKEAAVSHAASLVQFHSPSLGATDARVTIVEFFDPSCEACRAYYPVVKSILEENKGKVRLVLRYAAFHKDSDVVVKILEAARAQGKYWQVLDIVMESQPIWADHGNPQVARIWEFLQPVGLDIEKAKRDMNNPSFNAMLSQDMADVAALKVTRTPTFYVNGKPLLTMGEQGLRALVRDEIKATSP